MFKLRYVDSPLINYEIQALLEAKKNKKYSHILDSTSAVFFFGSPHQGLRTDELEQALDYQGGDLKLKRFLLLQQIRSGSDFLKTQKNEITQIWPEKTPPRVVSFYETMPSPTVRRVSLCRGFLHYKRKRSNR